MSVEVTHLWIFPTLSISFSSTRVSMMRCLVCLWWVFQPSGLCFTTVTTSNTWLSLPPNVTEAGTLSTCSLILALPVGLILRKAVLWVGFYFFVFHYLSVAFSSVNWCVIMCMCLSRFWELSVVLEMWRPCTNYQLQQTLQLPLHIQHRG